MHSKHDSKVYPSVLRNSGPSEVFKPTAESGVLPFDVAGRTCDGRVPGATRTLAGRHPARLGSVFR